MESLARDLHEARIGPLAVATDTDILAALDAARSEHAAPFTREFLLDMDHVVVAFCDRPSRMVLRPAPEG